MESEMISDSSANGLHGETCPVGKRVLRSWMMKKIVTTVCRARRLGTKGEFIYFLVGDDKRCRKIDNSEESLMLLSDDDGGWTWGAE
jgi:hypothetical protein